MDCSLVEGVVPVLSFHKGQYHSLPSNKFQLILQVWKASALAYECPVVILWEMIQTSLLEFAWWRSGDSFVLHALFAVAETFCFFPNSKNAYHDPIKNSAFPLSIYRLILMFLSTKSLSAGVSHRATLVPSAAKYNPTRPTPQPSSKTVFPTRLNSPYYLRLWRALARIIA